MLALSAGCQSISLPFLSQRSSDPLVSSSAKMPPVHLGPPILQASSVETSGPGQTSWRPVQRDGLLPEGVVAASEWHPAQRDPGPSNTNIVARTAGSSPLVLEPRKDGSPANFEAVRLAPIPPPGKSSGDNDLTLPRPSPLQVESTAGSPVPIAGAIPSHGPVHSPRELQKVQFPPYRIEPPDILLVDVSGIGEKLQRIRGPHLVRPDGTISLGVYGSARVAGATIDEARSAIVAAINTSGILGPEAPPISAKDISVDVQAYNSKVYYLITDGGGYGEQVYRLPFTGNETVLDAISLINGIPPVGSKRHIWVARRVPDGAGHGNILPVDWKSITQGGSAATNYQIMPGDRIYVQSQHLIRIDSGIAKILSPIERVLGTTLLGSETVNSIRNRTTSGVP
jgi:polysaccharide export outer membrane protein